MSNNAGNRPVPAVLASPGVVVPAELCGVLAAALDTVISLAGQPAPVGVRRPTVHPAVAGIANAARAVAVEVEARRHRELAAAQLAVTSGAIAPGVSPASDPSPLGDDEITSPAVAKLLGVSGQRVRQLAASGLLPARRGPHKVWCFRRADVDFYLKWRNGDSDHGERDGNGDAGRSVAWR